MRHPGFSLLEVTIVVALMLVTLAAILPSLSSFQRRETLRTIAQDVSQTLVRARDRAQASERGNAWGVKLLNGSYVLYAGDSYEKRATAYDEPHSVNPVISFLGLTEVTFRKGSGEPKAAGALTLTQTQGGMVMITINSAGNISIGSPQE